MKKKVLVLIAAAVFVFGILGLPVVKKAYAGDCDTNAVIYCGVISKTDLLNKLNKGTGKQYQSSKELKALFAKYNANTADVYNLQVGRVTKDNKVYIGNKLVASNVYTMGRHNISGSTKIAGLPYPLYLRHPSVSFNPNSLDAYVFLNYDGSMRYAVIKSCGNIVVGVVRTPPVPPVTPTTVNINVRKFYDANGNRVQDENEGLLAGWEFRVTGTGFSQTVTTLPDGTLSVTGLKPGTYTVTEVLKSGWKNTTGISIVRNVTSDPATQLFMFGNQEIVTPPVTPPTGGGDTATLPVTGTKEWVLAGLVLVLLGAGLWWVRSKDMLRMAKRRKPTGEEKPEAVEEEAEKSADKK
jgi:hypothetical protein